MLAQAWCVCARVGAKPWRSARRAPPAIRARRDRVASVCTCLRFWPSRVDAPGFAPFRLRSVAAHVRQAGKGSAANESDAGRPDLEDVPAPIILDKTVRGCWIVIAGSWRLVGMWGGAVVWQAVARRQSCGAPCPFCVLELTSSVGDGPCIPSLSSTRTCTRAHKQTTPRMQTAGQVHQAHDKRAGASPEGADATCAAAAAGGQRARKGRDPWLDGQVRFCWRADARAARRGAPRRPACCPATQGMDSRPVHERRPPPRRRRAASWRP